MSFIHNDFDFLKKIENVLEKEKLIFKSAAPDQFRNDDLVTYRTGVVPAGATPVLPVTGKPLQDGTTFPKFEEFGGKTSYDALDPKQKEEFNERARTYNLKFKEQLEIYNQTFRTGETPQKDRIDLEEAKKQQEDVRRLAKAYIINLRRNLGDTTVKPKPKAPIGYVDDNGANVKSGTLPPAKVADFRTLTDFCHWLAVKKVTWNNKRIAYVNSKQGQNGELTETQANSMSPRPLLITGYPPSRDQRQIDRTPYNYEVWVLGDELIKLLEYLRDYESSTNESKQLFKIMLAKIIGEFNVKNPGRKISVKSTIDPSELNLPNNLIVDGFANRILDPNNALVGLDRAPEFQGVAVPLYVDTLKDKAKFLNWFKDFKLSNNTDNPCIAINIIFQRAQYLNSNPNKYKDKENYNKAAELYLKKVQEYGKDLTFEGKICSVTSAGTTSGPATTQPTTTGAGTGAGTGVGGAANQQTITAVKDFGNSLPLELNNISLDKIDLFLRKCNDFAAYDPSITQNRALADTVLNSKINTKLYEKNAYITLTSPSAIGNLLSQPENSYCEFVKNLQSLINYIATIIRSYFSKYYEIIKTDTNLYNRVIAQVGLGENIDYCYATRNYNQLNQLLNLVPACRR